jgi:hypothetical protein
VLTQPGGAAGTGPAVTRAEAWFSVAAPEGRPVGVTARLRVELASGSVTGRLLLSRADGAWQVFGYDLARSGRAPAGSGASR